ncbi:hypothetical protein RND71_003414 [Anisodus tanguticus]|uniref:Uncharacterized protein n=1 Tax=Anisodus tanguticus TaxID=243964 RepID=A0AAE1SWQ8_9SOLA|nr:hypothetical protein RND71_003414 [Anisodus tanguticus]
MQTSCLSCSQVENVYQLKEQVTKEVVNPKTKKAQKKVDKVAAQEDRKKLWDELRSLDGKMSSSWLAMGYYNAIRDSDDRMLGIVVQEGEIKDFNDFMMDTGMEEMKIMQTIYPDKWQFT